jgi:xylulokinase
VTVKAAVGLDIGTTSVKAVARTAAGRVIASASSGPLSLTAPAAGWAVQSTEALHGAIVECLGGLAGALPSGTDAVALSAAVQSGSLVVADDFGRAEPSMTTWMDTRTSAIVEQWHREGTAAMIRRISGWSAQPGLGLAQIDWLRRNDPDGWTSAARFGSADDFVVSLLTGSWITNPSNAAGMQLLDIGTGEWSGDLCDLVGISVDRLSQLRPSGSSIGELTDAMADRTGLPRDLPVVAGGHDQTCTALALGVAEPGEALLAAGTAWVLTTVVDAAEADSVPEAMNVSFHVVDGMRTSSRYLGGLGASMEWWLAEAAFGLAGDRYERLAAELAVVEITADSPLFLRTSDSDGEAARPGAGRFWPDDRSTDRAARALAIMEFAAFEVRSALASLPHRNRPASLTLVGGAGTAPGWPQLIADVCAKPITVVSAHSWPAIGASMLAAGSAEPTIANGAHRLDPRAESVTLFDHRYRAHLELSQENRR